LVAGEIGVDHQPGAVAYLLRQPRSTSAAQAGAVRRSCQTMALRQRRTRLPVPHHGGFALVGDADGGNIGGR
jgi:hypothetical protein